MERDSRPIISLSLPAVFEAPFEVPKLSQQLLKQPYIGNILGCSVLVFAFVVNASGVLPNPSRHWWPSEHLVTCLGSANDSSLESVGDCGFCQCNMQDS